MAKTKFYAVRNGRQTGIFESWAECAAQVRGYEGAVYKSFATRTEAEAFLGAAPKRAVTRRAPDNWLAHIAVYTDGGCLVNPGPGGYGVVILHAGQRQELSGGYRLTTNNRMELMACIAGLAALSERGKVTLFTDSQYLAKSLTHGWAKRWRAAHWIREKQRVPNADLWAQLLDLCERHELTVEWVRGHAGDPENERCHALATEALRQRDLPADAGYRRGQSTQTSLFDQAQG